MARLQIPETPTGAQPLPPQHNRAPLFFPCSGAARFSACNSSAPEFSSCPAHPQRSTPPALAPAASPLASIFLPVRRSHPRAAPAAALPPQPHSHRQPPLPLLLPVQVTNASTSSPSLLLHRLCHPDLHHALPHPDTFPHRPPHHQPLLPCSGSSTRFATSSSASPPFAPLNHRLPPDFLLAAASPFRWLVSPAAPPQRHLPLAPASSPQSA